jgi:hypothetical protein
MAFKTKIAKLLAGHKSFLFALVVGAAVSSNAYLNYIGGQIPICNLFGCQS